VIVPMLARERERHEHPLGVGRQVIGDSGANTIRPPRSPEIPERGLLRAKLG